MAHSGPTLSPFHVKLIVFLILGLYPLVGMGIDLIAPSLPAISLDLKSSSAMVKNIVALYLLGYAVGNFLLGFLSDALGRRKLIIMGFFTFTAASVLPIIFPNIVVLLIARFLQGFAIAGYAGIGRAILSDLLTAEKLKHTAPLIATMWGIGPVIGPVIGGYLQYYFNWQACFYFYALLGLIGCTAMFFILPETHFHRQPFDIKQMKNNFMTIITHRVFLGTVIMMGTSYSILIVFNTLGPFLIQTVMGRSSIYFGHVALMLGVVFLLGTFLCRFLLKHYATKNILFGGSIVFTLVAAASLLIGQVYYQNIAVIIVSSLLMFFGTGIMYPAGMSLGLTLFRHLAGSGSAMMNLINILITSLTAFLMGFVNPTTIVPILWIYLLLLLLNGAVYLATVHSAKN